jgi:hypothetical protein
MINAPTIVRLIRFPKSLRLEKQGKEYRGPLRRSGPLILSERHEAVEVTFRLNEPGLSFATGGNTVTAVEAFNEGEQRDLLVTWALVSNGKARPAKIVMEIDVRYQDSGEKHTGTAPLTLTYGMRRGVAGVVAAGAAAAAVALAAAASGRRKKRIIAADDEDVEVSLFNVAPTSRTRTTAARTNIKGAKVTVADEDEVELAVYNVPRTTKKAASSKKASSSSKKAASSRKAAAKKAPAKKAPAKKAGGTRPGSSASRSAPRTGARGSSKAQKSSSRRTTRKSR